MADIVCVVNDIIAYSNGRIIASAHQTAVKWHRDWLSNGRKLIPCFTEYNRCEFTSAFCEISIHVPLSAVARLMTGVLYIGCYYPEGIKDMAQKEE